MAVDVPKILEGFGMSSESVQKVKLGRGVVGKTTYVAIALMGVLGVVAARVATPDAQLWVGGMAVFAFLTYFIGALVFAHKNPAASLMEGAELLAWQQTEMAAKGIGLIQPAQAIEPVKTQSQIAEASNDGLDGGE